eukprot:UN07248
MYILNNNLIPHTIYIRLHRHTLHCGRIERRLSTYCQRRRQRLIAWRPNSSTPSVMACNPAAPTAACHFTWPYSPIHHFVATNPFWPRWVSIALIICVIISESTAKSRCVTDCITNIYKCNNLPCILLIDLLN